MKDFAKTVPAGAKIPAAQQKYLARQGAHFFSRKTCQGSGEKIIYESAKVFCGHADKIHGTIRKLDSIPQGETNMFTKLNITNDEALDIIRCELSEYDSGVNAFGTLGFWDYEGNIIAVHDGHDLYIDTEFWAELTGASNQSLAPKQSRRADLAEYGSGMSWDSNYRPVERYNS